MGNILLVGTSPLTRVPNDFVPGARGHHFDDATIFLRWEAVYSSKSVLGGLSSDHKFRRPSLRRDGFIITLPQMLPLVPELALEVCPYSAHRVGLATSPDPDFH